jgi:hypothetical protein
MQFVAIGWKAGQGVAIVNTYTKPFTRSHIMNIAKNMEAIFLAAITLISVTSFATASAPQAAAQARATASTDVAMQVVTVSAKRLTPAEKAAAQ